MLPRFVTLPVSLTLNASPLQTHFGYKRQDCEQASGLPNSSNPCNDAACQNATSAQSTGGATCGTSYSLFKRSLFACVLYDSAFCGAADEWFAATKPWDASDPANLSPIGAAQVAAKAFASRYAGTLGTHDTHETKTTTKRSQAPGYGGRTSRTNFPNTADVRSLRPLVILK